MVKQSLNMFIKDNAFLKKKKSAHKYFFQANLNTTPPLLSPLYPCIALFFQSTGTCAGGGVGWGGGGGGERETVPQQP